MTEEAKILMCMPMDIPGMSHIAGFVVRQCADCGADMSVSPSGQRLLASRPDIEAICLRCARKRDRAESEPMEIQLAPGAGAELLANGMDPLTVAAIEAFFAEKEKKE